MNLYLFSHTVISIAREQLQIFSDYERETTLFYLVAHSEHIYQLIH